MIGVLKLLDVRGRVHDEAPFFGSPGPLKFGVASYPYRIDRVVFVDSTGTMELVETCELKIEANDRPVIRFTFDPRNVLASGFLPRKIREVHS